jgi:hypothetical protein
VKRFKHLFNFILHDLTKSQLLEAVLPGLRVQKGRKSPVGVPLHGDAPTAISANRVLLPTKRPQPSVSQATPKSSARSLAIVRNGLRRSSHQGGKTLPKRGKKKLKRSLRESVPRRQQTRHRQWIRRTRLPRSLLDRFPLPPLSSEKAVYLWNWQIFHLEHFH